MVPPNLALSIVMRATAVLPGLRVVERSRIVCSLALELLKLFSSAAEAPRKTRYHEVELWAYEKKKTGKNELKANGRTDRQTDPNYKGAAAVATAKANRQTKREQVDV